MQAVGSRREHRASQTACRAWYGLTALQSPARRLSFGGHRTAFVRQFRTVFLWTAAERPHTATATCSGSSHRRDIGRIPISIGDVCGRVVWWCRRSVLPIPAARCRCNPSRSHPLFGAWVEIPASAASGRHQRRACQDPPDAGVGTSSVEPDACVAPHAREAFAGRSPRWFLTRMSGERVRAQGFALPNTVVAMATQSSRP